MKFPNLLKATRDWLQALKYSDPHYNPPQKLWIPSNKVIQKYMPLVDPKTIKVERIKQTVIVQAEGYSYPLDHIGDKYYEEFTLSSQTLVSSVLYHPPYLKIFLGQGISGDKYATYTVGEYYGNSGNT